MVRSSATPSVTGSRMLELSPHHPLCEPTALVMIFVDRFYKMG
jgi:hypothetical protein